MKTSLFSAIFISSTLLVTACTPADKAVVDKNLRGEIQAQNARKSGGGKKTTTPRSPTEFTLGDYALFSFLVERNIEAVELVKLALGDLDQKTTPYEIETQKDEKSAAVNLVKITASKERLEYVSNEGSWKTKANKTLNATVKQNEAGVEEFKILGAGLLSSADSVDKKKFYVNLKEKTYDLTLTPEEKAYKLVVSTQGSLDGAKGEGNKFHDIKVELILMLDKESLKTSEVKVLNLESKIEYPGFNGKTFSATISGKNTHIKISSFCNEMSGELTGKAGPKKTFKVVLANEEIKVGDKWTNKLATCGKRPTVDLSRLQVF